VGVTAALSLEEDPGACQGTLMTNALANIYRSRAGPRGGTRKNSEGRRWEVAQPLRI